MAQNLLTYSSVKVISAQKQRRSGYTQNVVLLPKALVGTGPLVYYEPALTLGSLDRLLCNYVTTAAWKNQYEDHPSWIIAGIVSDSCVFETSRVETIFSQADLRLTHFFYLAQDGSAWAWFVFDGV
jgi:hypothetical protein